LDVATGLGEASVAVARMPGSVGKGVRVILRSITNGLGSYLMSFSHYAEVSGVGGPDDFLPAVGMRV
jgi:translation elongation factor EF-G